MTPSPHEILTQRVEFERLLANYAEIYRLHHGAKLMPSLRSVEVLAAKLHNARCDLITWVELHGRGTNGEFNKHAL